jgi:beta-galactosidase
MDVGHNIDRWTLPLKYGWGFRWEESQHEQSVDLPHCWNERDTFQMGLHYAQGTGTYRRTFSLPSVEDPSLAYRWQLRSDGFYGTGPLSVNGKRIANVDGQYLGLREDVTDALQHGSENCVELTLNNRYQRHVLPGKKNPDFLLHGGLAGAVSLVRLPGVHFDDRSLQVVCENPLSDLATVTLSVTVHNALKTATRVTVTGAILSSDECVASGTSNSCLVVAGRSVKMQVVIALDNPTVWSLDNPFLYRAVCRLEVGADFTDEVSSRFGIREARFDGERGFFLNGEHVLLQGVNRHESIPGFGSALPAKLHWEDAQQIRDLGLNFVRLSHYPQHPEFLDACDELGILVFAEIASWKSVRPGLWALAAYRQLRAMIQRDRNHPSIILWGFANESRSKLAFRKMVRIAKQLDPGRDTIYAENHLHRGIRWRTLKQTSVLGINYELVRLDDAHKLSQKGSLVVSEISNCAYTGRGDEEAELKQIAALERDLTIIESKPFVAGYALWCYSDYASQRRDRCRRRPGIVDAWRLPKMSATYMRARTAQELFVGVHGDWGTAAGDGQRDIHIFSNSERLIVSVAGKVLAEVSAKLYTLVTVPFSPETLVVTAFRGDESTVAHLISHGAPERLLLAPEQGLGNAGERETVGVLVRVVDRAGVTVADYHGDVALSVSGQGKVRFFAEQDVVEMHAGVGRFFVTGSGVPGIVGIQAMSEGLLATETSIEFIGD